MVMCLCKWLANPVIDDLLTVAGCVFGGRSRRHCRAWGNLGVTCEDFGD